MPASVTRGYTFGSTELVTHTKLHSLVDSATITGIDQSNLAASIGTVTRSASAPSDTDALWLDTTTMVLKLYNGTEWVPAGPYALLTNKSGSQRVAGDVVIVDVSTAGSFTTTTSANNQLVAGVVMETIANNADGVIALPGARVTTLSVTATTAIGDYLTTSTTAAAAIPSATPGKGVFAIALASRSGVGTITEALLIRFDSGSTAATQAEMEAASSTSAMVTPGRVQYHPGVAKAWCNFDGSGTPTMRTTHNMDSSITDHATGEYTVSFTTDFSSANYVLAGWAAISGSMAVVTATTTVAIAAGTVRVGATTTANTSVDATTITLVAFGDQA